MRAALLASLLLAGCGRVAFDERELDAGDAATMGLLVVAGEVNAAELELDGTPYAVHNVAGVDATLDEQLELIADAVNDAGELEPVAVLLVHGETAAATPEAANAYPRELALFAYNVERASRDDIYWLVATLRSDAGAGDRVSRATVRYAQQTFVMSGRDERELIDTDVLPGGLELDGERYTPALQRAVLDAVDLRMSQLSEATP